MTGRVPLIAGNWKMHLNHLEAIALVQKLAFTLTDADYERVEVAVLPPFTSLRSVQTAVEGDRLRIRYGAQDLAAQDSGAYTGDVSGSMLAKLHCTYVVVGHSERRQHHHETDELVQAKVRAALRSGLVPIVCVGEVLEVREAGDYLRHCVEQLRIALRRGPDPRQKPIVIAYEPVWAIGTGKVAEPGDAQEVCRALRATVADLYDPAAADTVRILYGGSVKADNAAGIMAEPDVDGALVGGASLDPDEFVSIVRYDK